MATYRSLTDLAETTQDEMLPNLINILKMNDELTSVLISNAGVTDRPTIKGNRLVDEGAASYVNCDSTITPVAVSGSPFSYDLFWLNRSFDVCINGQNLYSSFTDVTATELEGALSAMRKQIAADAMTGNGTTAPAGLETQITNSFAVATSGDFDLGDMDRMYDEVLSRNQLYYVGAPATVRAVVAEMRSAGTLDYQTLAGTELRVPSYLGIPVLRNANASAGELHLFDASQFKVIFGESEDANIGGIFSMVPVGVLETALKKRWHLYCNWLAVLLDTQAAVTLTGVV